MEFSLKKRYVGNTVVESKYRQETGTCGMGKEPLRGTLNPFTTLVPSPSVTKTLTERGTQERAHNGRISIHKVTSC